MCSPAIAATLLLIAAFVTCLGCASPPTNPSFSISVLDAQRDLQRIADDRRPLDRPLVIVTGFMDPGLAAIGMNGRFRSLFDDKRILAISLGDRGDLAACRDKVLAAVQQAFPSDNPMQTIEVDVIGYSLGGVVARYAALPRHQQIDTTGTTRPAERSLRIVRLFTISTPHRGADEATRMPLLHAIQGSLRSGSPELRQIDETPISFPIYPYIVLGDRAIGEANAAPIGQTPWWVPNRAFADVHNSAYDDPRIVADIARRLRDEPSHAIEPPADLPR